MAGNGMFFFHLVVGDDQLYCIKEEDDDDRPDSVETGRGGLLLQLYVETGGGLVWGLGGGQLLELAWGLDGGHSTNV